MREQPYRPSNGSEEEWFMAGWCEKCVKDSESHSCPIIGRTMSLMEFEPGYPEEWVEDDDGPRCTAFWGHDKPEALGTINDKRQIGLGV